MPRHARTFTVALLAAAACLVAERARLLRISAADSESLTWGATDPTWSPDGRKLAFSLFGGIWQVDAAGGAAQQLSAGSGYHAHPAWSPRGNQIAYVRGAPPAGRLPNVSGSLAVLDLASGDVRDIATPFPLAGNPAWSP